MDTTTVAASTLEAGRLEERRRPRRDLCPELPPAISSRFRRLWSPPLSVANVAFLSGTPHASQRLLRAVHWERPLSARNSMRTSTSQRRPCLSVSPSRLFQGKSLHLESSASEPNVWRRMSSQLLGCLARRHFGNCLLLHASTCMAVLMPCRSWHAIVGSSQTPRSMTVPRSSRSQRFLSTCNDSL